TILARPSPSCAYDDDRLRLPPASPARNSKAGKKESTGRRLSQLCPPCATPSSNSSLDYRRSDARIVENGFATSGGLSKSAKVVLGRVLINEQIGGPLSGGSPHNLPSKPFDLGASFSKSRAENLRVVPAPRRRGDRIASMFQKDGVIGLPACR